MSMFKTLVPTRGAACCLTLAVILTLMLVATAFGVTVDPSNRYYRDGSGTPVFLTGYYGWAAVPDGYYIDHPARYKEMVDKGGQESPIHNKINYVRISLGVNRFSSTSNPPSWPDPVTGVRNPTPVPFLYSGGKYNLNAWDPIFWDNVQGLEFQVRNARDHGVIAHVSFFDGVELRDNGGAAYGYANTYWNPGNHSSSFYPSGSYGDCGGCFYRTSEFTGNTGIGKYQKLLIDKTIATLASYNNVMYEVGNELGAADAAWNSAVIAYVKSKTSAPITQGGITSTSGYIGSGCQGWSPHYASTVPMFKSSVATLVGNGYPAWEDPDNNEWATNHGFPAATYDTACRQAAWYEFAGGAAGFGGFTVDFWDWWGTQRGFAQNLVNYMNHLQNFLTDSAVQFSTMTPQHSLISNSTVNSCLASSGVEYVAYILSDATATLNLSGVSGAANYQLYNPITGAYTTEATVSGGGNAAFTRPAGWSDWVIHVYTGGSRAETTEQTLLVKPAGAITIDGNPSEWNVTGCESIVHAGVKEHGSAALTGFDGGNLYYAAYALVLPTSASDHTAKVYSRHDATYQYFLVRCDDMNVEGSGPTSANWQNDCIEIYIDPSHDGGATPIGDSTSDVQLVIDHLNQKNVYMTTAGYATQVLNGITSAVTTDGSGWWLEVRIAKNALSPTLPSNGVFGVDFNYRDNDGANNPALTTVYTWADTDTSGFPSKIPDHWGNAFQGPISATPYPGPNASAIPGIVQAENYDSGGEGVGYHDTTSGNAGGAYRSDGVDIQAASDAGGGYCVGWMEAGEWLNYTVNVAAAGNYNLKLRVATPNSGCTFHVEIDGQDVTGTKSIAATGGYQNWNTLTLPNIYMNSCQHWVKVVVDSGGWNFNHLEFQAVTQCAAGDPFDMAPTYTIGAGRAPSIATDSQGNVHLVFTTNGTSIYYRKYAPTDLTTPIVSDTITPAGGAYWLSIKCDANDAPHIAFSENVGDVTMPYTTYTYYTNRIGGSWKTPLQVNHDTGMYGPDDIGANYPSLNLWGSYAYIGTWYTVNAGKIIRLTNLSTTPAVDTSIRSGTGYVLTGERASIAVNGQGHVFSIGRQNGSGGFSEEYDANLNTVCSIQKAMFAYPGAPHRAWAGADDNVHFISWESYRGGSFPCLDISEMCYQNTARRTGCSYPTEIHGLRGGAAGTGPDGTEPTGWWNDDVAPVIVVDKINRVYVAWRNWTPAGEGKITTVDNSGFVEVCNPNPTCGGNICTGVTFASNVTRGRWYNCEMAPALTGGVYVVWPSGGTLYIRGVGVGSACNQPPPPPANLAAAAGSNQIGLSWTNPNVSDFVGTVIRYRTDTFPASPTDGTLVCNRTAAAGSSDLYTHTGLVNGVTYYYSAFAYDEQPLYSDPSVASAMPHLLPDWLNETFDGYNNADLGGQGGWSSIGSSGQVQSAVAKGGTGKAALLDTVAVGPSSGNQIVFTDKTTGTMLVDFDVAQDGAGTAGQELAYVSVYGSNSPAEIMRIHIQKGRVFAEYGPANPGTLGVVSSSVSNLTWNNIRIGFNIDAKTFDVWYDGVVKGTNYAWKTGATRVSRVVIGSDRNANLTTQKCYIDNLRVEPKPGQVASVSDDGAWSPSLSKLHFTFPAVAGTPEYQYAIGTSSGGTQTRDWTSCGTSTDVIATGLSLTENTTNYYVSVRCLTQFGSAGDNRASNGVKVGVGVSKIKDAKALADGTSTQVKALRGKLVSAPFSGYFYIQEPDGPFGLKVLSNATVATGDQVDVCGVMKGAGAERYLDGIGTGTGYGVVKAVGPGGPHPVALGNAGIGGVMLNANTPGVVGGLGPNSVGLYTIAFGKVTQRQTADPKYFYIDDGTGLKDGTTTGGVENVGVRIVADPATYPAGSYVSVTGVVSCFTSSGLRPEMIPQTIQLLHAP